MDFTAHAITPEQLLPLEPADLKRDWAEAEKRLAAGRHPGFARANQAGWVLRAPIGFRFTWNGEPKPFEGLTFMSTDAEKEVYGSLFSNAFGHGILTISIPYHFRTPPGYGLIVRGPTNTFVDNMLPLDGIIETDWLESSFTMNWRIMRPHQTTGFKKGDPLCMILPYPLELLESMTPRIQPLVGVSPVLPAPAVTAGSWRHVLPETGPGLDTAGLPGKARLRLKRF